LKVPSPVTGKITRAYFETDTSTALGDVVFDINIAGVSIFLSDPSLRPKILSTQSVAIKSGLLAAVSEGQEITVDLDTLPAGAVIGDDLKIILSVEEKPSRQVAVLTTASIADGVRTTGAVQLGRTYHILNITADNPCTVLVYLGDDYRTADAVRLLTQKPVPSDGVVTQVKLVLAKLSVDCVHVAGSDMNATVTGNIAVAVVNESGVTQAIEVTF
jgi:hypothetical protein